MKNTQTPPDTLPVSLEDYRLPEQLAREHKDLFTPEQLRWMLHRREHNGLSAAGAVVKFQRRLYINVPLFCRWFAAQKA